MSNISGFTLYKILLDPDAGLQVWPKLKLSYFNSEFTSLYSEIARFYDKNNKLPNFNELQITCRNPLVKNNIKALQKLQVPEDVDLDLLIEALIDEFTQNQALQKIDKFLDKVTIFDSHDIKRELAEIVLYLEEKTHISEEICKVSDMILFDREEISGRIHLGLNNIFDGNTGGVPLTELILIGGYRGAGKSVVCTNIVNNQFTQDNIGLYFSIEMRAREVFLRSIANLAGVSAVRLKKGESTPEELISVAGVRAQMYLDGQDLLNEYYSKRIDYDTFDKEIVKKQVNPDKQLIIVDNQRLTIPDIDLNIQKFKAQYKDKLKVVVIDYINAIDTVDQFDWKSQVSLSSQLKNLARKYNIVIIAPYQIDKTGEARFSKGILDKADIAMVLDAQDTHINFKSVKTRNIPPFEFNSAINWNTLRLDPAEFAVKEEAKEEEVKSVKNKMMSGAVDIVP